MGNLSLFDFLDAEEQAKFKPIKSNDWKWTMANDYPEKNGLKVFSCFACGGGSTMGYKLAGCEVLGCVEIDKRMNEVYVKNHNPKYNYLMDIREFNKIPDDEIPEELKNLDILDGSPPCTTFSMAGLREESWGKEKKFREGQTKQTLDDLSFVFIETVAKLKPKCVIMENVEGLIRGEAWSYVQKIYKQLNGIGYKVKHWLLKGEYMGVPQKRHRVFFIALREDIDFDLMDLDMSFNYEPITYGEIKEGEGPANKEAQYYYIMENAIRADTNLRDTRVRIGLSDAQFNCMYCWEDEIIPTLAAKHEYYDPIEKTKISGESIRNSQTFPQDYDFMSDLAGNWCYICGMSVPPIMIKRIVTRLIESGVFDND